MRYLTGTKKQVISNMARLAIRSEEALIEAYNLTREHLDIESKDYADCTNAIAIAERSIEDYRRFV